MFTRLHLATILTLVLLVLGPIGCHRDRDSATNTSAPPELSAEIVAEHNRGVALMGRFDYGQAHNVFAALASANPKWLDVRVDLAIATLNRQQPGDDKSSAAILSEVIQQRPGDLRALFCRAILHLYASEPESALTLFRQVAEADPNDAYALYYTGQCHFQLGEYDRALELYLTAQKKDPYLRSTYYGAFQSAQQLGDMEVALKHFEDFQKLDDNPQARLAEIKYTRMGPKAEVRAIDANLDPIAELIGPLFAAPMPLSIHSDAAIAWRALDAGQPIDNDEQRQPNITVCDINQDGQLDVFIANAIVGDVPNAVLFHTNNGYRVAIDHPLSNVTSVTAALWGDIDNDGLTDVYLCRDGPNQLWQQTTGGNWHDITERSQTSGGESLTVDGACFDADHDGDLDLFLVNADGPNELLNNNLDGTFRPLAADQRIAGDGHSRGIVLADFDSDRDVDILVVNEHPPHEFYRNDRLWNYEPAVGFEPITSSEIWSAVAADTNADGAVELFVNGPDGVIHWQRDHDSESWISANIGTNIATKSGPIAVQDINGNGQAEVIVTTKSGWQVLSLGGEQLQSGESTANWTLAAIDTRGYALLWPNSQSPPTLQQPGTGRYSTTLLRFSGKDNKADQMRSNASGIGVLASIRVGRNWTTAATFRSQSGRGQSLQPIAVGLQGRENMDFMTVRWPDGVFQSELDLATGEHLITETQRQLSSCPVVFVWDGQQYRFVTDVLGVAGIGFNQGRGEYPPPRPWENLLLPQELLQPIDGQYVIKLGEPMEEVLYLDAARLIKYELPPGWEMVVDERFATDGREPTGEPLYYRTELLPKHARNHDGDDVLAAVSFADGLAVDPAKSDRRFLGRTEPFELTLEFESALDEIKNPVLAFHGWVEYPYSQTMFAAWQAAADYDPPTLAARGSDGQWCTIRENFGYMAGMPRQSALPLDAAELPVGTTALRIRTNIEVYFDSVSVIAAERCPGVVRQEHELLAATVSEVGFPKRTNNGQKRPSYDYSIRTPLWDTRHLVGFYTPFGPAQAQALDVDGESVVIGPGEEIELRFAAEQPPSTEGVSTGVDKSFFVLELAGWCKDHDLFTENGETVDPIPGITVELKRKSPRHPKDPTGRYR